MPGSPLAGACAGTPPRRSPRRPPSRMSSCILIVLMLLFLILYIFFYFHNNNIGLYFYLIVCFAEDIYPGVSDVKRIKVSPPKPGHLYPSLSDVEATTEPEDHSSANHR